MCSQEWTKKPHMCTVLTALDEHLKKSFSKSTSSIEQASPSGTAEMLKDLTKSITDAM